MFLQAYSIPVKEVMSKDLFIINESDEIMKATDYLFKNNKKEVLVCNEHGLAGIITGMDLYKVLKDNMYKLSIDKLMTKEVIWVEPDKPLSDCRTLMLENKIGRIPVLDKGEIIGVLREDIMRDYFYKGVEEGEEALKHIFNNIHEALCVVDSKGRVIIWNKNAERLYGVKEEELKGKYLEKFFPNAIDLQIFKTKKKVSNIYHSPKEGYHVIISASPIIINGKIYGVVSTEKDIVEIEELETELKRAENRLRELEKQIEDQSKANVEPSFNRIIGNSKVIQQKISIAKQISKTNASILLTGESGTGKEEFARAIHGHSQVSGNFVPVNCSAIPSELFESEFFGYEGGAFTGAKKDGKIGFFEQAKDGTLFLDEIGDLPIPMQAKLLRVIQDRKIKKVGGEKFIPIKVRIISATNRDLVNMVEESTFREELYYRINVIEIQLPSLKERKEDIILFVDHFLKEICLENNKLVPQIDNEVMEILVDYQWGGNIRELKNVVEYMAILCKDKTITKELIPKYIIESSIEDIRGNSVSTFDLNQSIANLELKMIKKALKITEGNRQKAAKLLNIPRTTLHSKMNKYNLYD